MLKFNNNNNNKFNNITNGGNQNGKKSICRYRSRWL